MTDVYPEEYNIIDSFIYQIKIQVYGWSVGPASCATVTQSTKGRQGILPLTNRYKG